MDDIIEPNSSFDFSKLSLAHPTGIQGGAYFTKLLHDGKPLYIQTPKSLTKQGFVKNGKKIYCDLMFDVNDETFINWIENLEVKCHELIFEKSDAWFQNSLDLNDIETAFNSLLKSYKSGKKYLVKANVKVNSLTNNPIIKIYNESETQLTIDDVNHETNIISILEVQGIKFTSRNFQIEIELKQTMVLNTDKIFESCLIKKKSTNPDSNQQNVGDFEKVNSEINSETTQKTNLPELLIEDLEKQNAESESELEKDKNNFLEILNVEGNKNVEENIHEIDNKNETELENYNKDENTCDNKIESENSQNLQTTNYQSLTLEDFDIVPVELNIDNENLETITLKKPNEVYYNLYKAAREKAKNAKKEAVLAYLEAKNIKKTYMLEDIDSSDEETEVEEE